MCEHDPGIPYPMRGIEKLRKRGVFDFENFTCAENPRLLGKRGGDYLRALAVALNALP